jgi:hypothetical protein
MSSYTYPSFRQVDLSACYLLHAAFLLSLLFGHDEGGDMFLRNLGLHSSGYTALYPRRCLYRTSNPINFSKITNKTITVATLPKARNVFGSLNTKIIGSNSIRGMDVSVSFSLRCTASDPLT